MKSDGESTPPGDVQEGLSYVRSLEDRKPKMALILGSGLGHLAESVEEATIIESSSIPGYPASTVEGHSGRLIVGVLEGVPVSVVQGRLHVYEGHDIDETTFPVRLVHAMGADRVIVTNAAGGINPLFSSGTIMFIVDHINLSFQGPLGAMHNVDGVPRHPARSEAYDPEWTDLAERCALRLGLRTTRGVYVWTRGPAYETKAEIRFLSRIGADAVGMSTVPEVLQARTLGMRVLGISTITNAAAGLGHGPLDHGDVLAVAAQVRSQLERLIHAVVMETAV